VLIVMSAIMFVTVPMTVSTFIVFLVFSIMHFYIHLQQLIS
jgi:hypothetical protein